MKRVVIGALAAGVLFALLVGLRSHLRHQTPRGRIDSAPLLQALVAAKQAPAASAAVKRACAADDVCGCVEVATRAALDADLHELALRTLDAAPKGCPRGPMLLGERSEALARAGSDSAQQAADLTLKADASNPYAELAQARIQYDKDKMGNCSEHAAKALKFGRGAEADRLLGRSALARSLYKECETHFQAVLGQNPNDAEAAFSSAVCADKVGDYLSAREGFLQALRIDPKHVRARVYLVVLTHNAGANDEARHHLAKLEEIMPKDAPEVLRLREILAGHGADPGPSPSGLTQTDGPVTAQGKR